MVSISVSMVGIRVGSISVVGIRIGSISMVGIRVGGITVRSLSISRLLVVTMAGISISISMMGIGVGSIPVAIRDTIAGISFRLSYNSCKQAQGKQRRTSSLLTTVSLRT